MLVRSHAYNTGPSVELSDDYVERARPIVRTRLAQGRTQVSLAAEYRFEIGSKSLDSRLNARPHFLNCAFRTIGTTLNVLNCLNVLKVSAPNSCCQIPAEILQPARNFSPT